jgi:hypothetical protein
MDSVNFSTQFFDHAQILVESLHIAQANRPWEKGAANAYIIYANINGRPTPNALLVICEFALPDISRLEIKTQKERIRDMEEERRRELQAHSERLREVGRCSRQDRNSVDRLWNIFSFPEPAIVLRLALENSPTSTVFIDYADRARKLQRECNLVLELLARAQTDTQNALLQGADAIQTFKRLQMDTDLTCESTYRYGL